MTDSRESGVTIVVLIVIVLIAGGIVTYMWQQRQAERELALRQQQQARELQREVAKRQELFLQREAEAAAEQRMANVTEEQSEPTEEAVVRILETQQQAWNAGDIDSFMQHYWKSDDLSFSFAGKVTRGWQATLESYEQRYPSPEQMGTLKFGNLEITPLGPDAAVVLGQWQLQRHESTDLDGNFTLIFRRIDGDWVIVHDHTSRAE